MVAVPYQPDYQHIDTCIYSDIMRSLRESNELFIGCACTDGCKCNANDDDDDEEAEDEDCICFAQHGSAYTKTGLLKDLSCTEPVYECNPCCDCPLSCNNRLVQKPASWRLETFQTSEKGYGLRTLDFIPKGSFVIEFVGEVISSEEACERLKITDSCYLLNMREYYGGERHMHHVDATKYGNNARFINHSCDPNLSVIPVRLSSTLPSLCLFSNRDIGIDEELSFDYGHTKEYPPLSSTHFSHKTKCQCKSDACKGFLPFHSDLFL